MRDIRFRAWDKADKRMMYRGVFDRNWYATPANNEKGCNCIRGITPEDRPQIELMQFTGLKDKNGKEIYEGDIVRIGNGEVDLCGVLLIGGDGVHVVEYDVKRARFIACYTENGLGEIFYDKVKIIGNIYENPELLTPPNQS